MSIQIAPDLLAEFEHALILHGAHDPDSGQRCAMEWAAYLANEPHSFQPSCVSPTVQKFMVQWNDALLDDQERTRLLHDLIPATLGTAGGDELALSRMVWDWLVQEWLATWFDLVPALKEQAQALRERGEEALPEARSAAAAAWDAAWDAARDAAWDAARAAAWDAARDAAWDAARAAAWAAAWDAAWDAAGDAARAAARAAAWAAARDAAWAAAGDAARAAAGDAARAAAWAAARAALRPTVERLQASARELVLRLCEAAKASQPAEASATA